MLYETNVPKTIGLHAHVRRPAALPSYQRTVFSAQPTAVRQAVENPSVREIAVSVRYLTGRSLDTATHREHAWLHMHLPPCRARRCLRDIPLDSLPGSADMMLA